MTKLLLVLLSLSMCAVLFASDQNGQSSQFDTAFTNGRDPFILGIFYGIFFFIIFYFLVLYIPSKDISYLLYAVWIFFLTGLIMVLEGIVFRHFLNGQYPLFNEILNYLFQGGAFICGFLFLRVLLSTGRETPLLDKFLLGNIGLDALYLSVYFFGVLLSGKIPETTLSRIFSPILGAVHSVFMIWTAVAYFKRKRRIIRFYILGLLVLVLSVWIRFYSEYSPSTGFFIVKYAYYIGILVLILCFSIAVSLRMNSIKKEQEDQRQKLIQADKMVSLGTLASSLAHDIANPNSAIISNALFLEQGYNNLKPLFERIHAEQGTVAAGPLPPELIAEKFPQAISGIINSADRIKKMIRELREYYRQSKPGEKGPVDVNKVIEAALALTGTEMKKNSITVNRNYAVDLPPIMANFGQLEQVIVNLIINSKQAIIEKKEKNRSLISGTEYIIIDTRVDGEKNGIVICIKDTGAGMDQKSIEHVKQAFFTTRLSKGGSGLGLYISDKIVADHGGQLDFISRKGQWTQAVITLPLSAKGRE